MSLLVMILWPFLFYLIIGGWGVYDVGEMLLIRLIILGESWEDGSPLVF
jgi:hypothetical protein